MGKTRLWPWVVAASCTGLPGTWQGRLLGTVVMACGVWCGGNQRFSAAGIVNSSSLRILVQNRREVTKPDVTLVNHCTALTSVVPCGLSVGTAGNKCPVSELIAWLSIPKKEKLCVFREIA